MSMVAIWQSDMYHLPPLCHIHLSQNKRCNSVCYIIFETPLSQDGRKQWQRVTTRKAFYKQHIIDCFLRYLQYFQAILTVETVNTLLIYNTFFNSTLFVDQKWIRPQSGPHKNTMLICIIVCCMNAMPSTDHLLGLHFLCLRFNFIRLHSYTGWGVGRHSGCDCRELV